MRAVSPRLADLRYPEPLDLASTLRTLDPGTLLLELAVGEERSHLFAVGRDHFAVYPLAVGEEQLRDRVGRLRRLIGLGAIGPERLTVEASRELAGVTRSRSETLLAPARAELADASRLVFVPEGPLHLLPFAVLLDPAADYGRRLGEARPVSVVASSTVLAQLRSGRRPAREPVVVAFGDPSYPPADGPAVRPGLLVPLPSTRAEVERLGELYGERATVWVGADATEERAKAVGREVAILHLAAHGLVDERRPLSSALALSVPASPGEGRDNGLLEAWEVFEQVRLDADLAVLSACDTALGQEVAGEGIVGLTRAFQYAGARSVLASLWSVADASTALLMRRFHLGLQAGMSRDEALRAAQLAFIAGPVTTDEGDLPRDLSHPFFWAAFQLYGDGE